MEEVDIAQVLSLKAGKHLGEAYQLHQQLESPELSHDDRNKLTKLEAEACIEAVILFQSSMEAVINEEIERHKHLIEVKKEKDLRLRRYRNLSFKNRWMKSYDELGMDPTKGALADYLEFYNEFRVTITHPTSRFVNIEKYNFENVYEGIRSGWLAMELLYEKLDKVHPVVSWETYCSECAFPSSL